MHSTANPWKASIDKYLRSWFPCILPCRYKCMRHLLLCRSRHYDKDLDDTCSPLGNKEKHELFRIINSPYCVFSMLLFLCVCEGVCVCETHTIEQLEKIKLETETQKMHQSLSHESQKSEPDASLEFKKRGHAWNWSLWTDSASCRKWSSQVDALLKVPLHSRPCRSRPDLEEEATRSFFKHWKNVDSKS